MGARTDADLAAAARAGDRAAFGSLVERHQGALLRTCRRALGDPAAAAEVAQEAVLQALTGLPALRDDAAFGPWLCGIGHNLARRTRRTPAPLPLELLPEPAAPGPEEREDGLQVLAAIAALPRGQRDAVALFYLADLSHVQIAARLGISVGAVKTRLHKARASLQTRLADLRKDLPPMPSSVPMHVADIRDTGGEDRFESHVVVLEEDGGARRLPIWIGVAEATTLALRLHDVATPRPDTYRFTADLLEAAGARLREVRVMRLADMIFYAQAVLEDGSTVDARPSDAINLALVAGAPVLVDEAVLAQAADSEREIGEELAAALASPRDGRAIAEEGRARLVARPPFSAP
jgi:RNA polymerase sigma-70 factor (ECF subfamily)